MNRCPVCNKKLNKNKAYAKINYNGEPYYLCCPLCQREFEKSPQDYVPETNQKSHWREKDADPRFNSESTRLR